MFKTFLETMDNFVTKLTTSLCFYIWTFHIVHQLVISFRTYWYWLINFCLSFQDIPPPGSYEVGTSFEASHGKKEPAQPRTEGGKRKKGSFLSSTKRFVPPRDVIIEKPEGANPGKIIDIKSLDPIQHHFDFLYTLPHDKNSKWHPFFT